MHFVNKNVPAKQDETFTQEKNVPPKRDPGFMNVGSLLGGIIYFHIKNFDFSIEFLNKVTCRLTEALALPGRFFSI